MTSLNGRQRNAKSCLLKANRLFLEVEGIWTRAAIIGEGRCRHAKPPDSRAVLGDTAYEQR